MDQIIIKNLKIFAYHGVHKSEKLNGQNFFIDAILYTMKTDGCVNDNIENVVSYSDVIKIIKKAMTSHPYNLIETAAKNVAKFLFDNFSDISELEITVKKPEAPIPENFDYVAVKITRKRCDFID